MAISMQAKKQSTGRAISKISTRHVFFFSSKFDTHMDDGSMDHNSYFNRVLVCVLYLV